MRLLDVGFYKDLVGESWRIDNEPSFFSDRYKITRVAGRASMTVPRDLVIMAFVGIHVFETWDLRAHPREQHDRVQEVAGRLAHVVSELGYAEFIKKYEPPSNGRMGFRYDVPVETEKDVSAVVRCVSNVFK